ncbi:MAG: holliday junction helicase RuvB, partial [Mycobacterium sp.]|nr:holliday junction helicase RuvB [Mycobacterium sp.]
MSRFNDDRDMEDDPDREVSAALTVGEGDVDASLRPRTLGEFIGQARVREQLQLVLEGAKNRGGTPDHILLAGPPGLGKTSLAMIIAAELATSLRVTSGPALLRAGDLAAMLSNLVEGDVLFIDEIHRIARPAEEMLYLAMEDFRVDVIVGTGPGATSSPLEVAPFTLVGATTRSGALTGPLRDRFGFTAHMDFYEPPELERVLFRSAGILGIELGSDAGSEIARRSRGTPRIANRLLRRVRDYAEVRADGHRERGHPHRSATEAAGEHREHGAIQPVQAQLVDVVDGKRGLGDVTGDDAVGADLGVVADPAQQPVGDAGRTPR